MSDLKKENLSGPGKESQSEPKKENPYVQRYLKKVTETYVDLERSELERQSVYFPPPEPSEAFVSRMDDIVRRLDEEDAKARKARWRAKRHTVMAAAAVFAVLVGITVGASFNLWGLPDRQDGDVSTHLNYAKHDLPEGVKYLYLPSYLPEGYRETDYNPSGSVIFLVFENIQKENQIIRFSQYPRVDFFSFDAEGVDLTEIAIGDFKGQTYKKDENNVVFWNNGDYAFILTSPLSVEEIVKVGESLQKQA